MLKLAFWGYFFLTVVVSISWLVAFPWEEAQHYRELNNTYDWYTVDTFMAPGFNDQVQMHYLSGSVASNLWFGLPLFCLFGIDRLPQAFFFPPIPWLVLSLGLLLTGSFMMVPSAVFCMSYLLGGVVFLTLNTLRFMFAIGRDSWI